MNFLKWKREILFLIPSITGGGTSSLFFTNSNQKYGSLTWKTKEDINSFLQSVGVNTSTFQPTDLLKQAGNFSTTIPTLTKALSTQIAKQIFTGELYKSTKYEAGIGKLYPKVLAAKKRMIEHQIKTLSKSKKRIKKSWTHDERRYLDGLKDYVLSRIDEKNIQDYFKTDPDSYLFKGKKITHISSPTAAQNNSSDSIAPLLGFLMGTWIESRKAGYYVHKLIPYAQTFSKDTKSFYQKKYKDIKLPDKPDYFFPDYERKTPDKPENLFKEYIDEWLKGKSYYEHWYSLTAKDRSEEIKQAAKIEWISPSNNTHKNIALRYLTERSDTNTEKSKDVNNGGRKYLSSLWKAISPIFLRFKKRHDCDSQATTSSTTTTAPSNSMQFFSTLWGDITHNPLNMFCINSEGKTQPDFMMFSPGPDDYKVEDIISSKIIFYRDDKGFNLLYPINKQIIDNAESKKKNGEEKKDPGEVENLVKNSGLVSEFKKYIEDNFSFLLLKYHKFIKNGNKNEQCSCHEIINKLIELMELSQKLKDWNEIWKFYDIRQRNNTVLTASTTGKNNFLNKMGTADLNPPEFLKLRIQKDLPKLSELEKTIQEYISKTSQYLNGSSEKNKDRQESFKFEKKSDTEGKNYWTISPASADARTQGKTCMKREVLQFVLESIFTQSLINRYLKIPLIFESSHDLFKNQQTSSTNHSQGNNSWEEKWLEEKWRNYLKDSSEQSKVTTFLIEKIKKAAILSKISDISDTTIHYLTTPNTSTSTNAKLNSWNNIESFINLTNLNDSNNQLSEQLRIFITSLYLMENSFEEYIENIRKTIKEEGFGVYAFTLSWNKFCTVDDFLLDPIRKVEMDSFWTPFNQTSEVNGKEWNKHVTDPRQCIKTSDRLAVSSLKRRHAGSNPASLLINFVISVLEGISTDRNLKNETLMGFKGLISAEDIKKLPEEFYYKIFSFLYKEGHINWNDIETQINNFKTNHQLIEYVKKINHINASIGKTFEFSDITKKPETTDEAKVVDNMDWFDLKKRKESLVKFIQDNLLKTNPSTQPRFRGLFFEKEKSEVKNSYVFEKHENSSIAYLIQITTDDLKNNDSFFKFVQEHLTPESLIQDVVKQAQNKALQMKAINNFLARGKWINDKKVFNLRSGDYFLKQQFSSIVTV
ncbi:DUF3713 domain-containing protein [Candidatus Mycoplasma haematominutum]|uniref:Uncharacterized protein n=1 Tax=Candidatus Mycoplasma haematominutum 'Birmingham 1' TaxID=1116213 RepID=G8C405_9MOLU|nr:DUF3713 domain-containing protein [Candidatus Mycoplasma haematominutum]CCE67053.1 hypothetical protein (homolog to MSU_0873) [Candidatus Mycoplasma haematominutum 'Birmingham 1']